MTQCKEHIYPPNSWGRPSRCSRQAVTESGHCKQHDPVKVQARRNAAQAKWNAEWDRKKWLRDTEKAVFDKARGLLIGAATLDDLRQVFSEYDNARKVDGQ